MDIINEIKINLSKDKINISELDPSRKGLLNYIVSNFKKEDCEMEFDQNKPIKTLLDLPVEDMTMEDIDEILKNFYDPVFYPTNKISETSLDDIEKEDVEINLDDIEKEDAEIDLDDIEKEDVETDLDNIEKEDVETDLDNIEKEDTENVRSDFESLEDKWLYEIEMYANAVKNSKNGKDMFSLYYMLDEAIFTVILPNINEVAASLALFYPERKITDAINYFISKIMTIANKENYKGAVVPDGDVVKEIEYFFINFIEIKEKIEKENEEIERARKEREEKRIKEEKEKKEKKKKENKKTENKITEGDGLKDAQISIF